MLLFTQTLAFTAKGVRKCRITRQKSICEVNLVWIFVGYWNEENCNEKIMYKCGIHSFIVDSERRQLRCLSIGDEIFFVNNAFFYVLYE